MSNKTKPTLEDLRKIPFPSGGLMLYFTGDKKFLYIRSQNKHNLKEAIQIAKRSGRTITLYPMEISVAHMREGLTEQNVGLYYEKDVLRFNMTSEEFCKEYFDEPIAVLHSKVKGTMKGEEFWVKKYIFYDGTQKNMRVFQV